MPNLLFRGAFIRHFDVRHDEDAKKFIRIHLTADFTEAIMEKMEWETVPDCVPKATLTGQITAHHMILTPSGKELLQHELQIAISEVRDFQLVRVKDEEGEPNGQELRFVALSNQAGAAALIESYIENVQRGVGTLKVAAQQQDLPFEETTAESPDDAEKAPALASKAEVHHAERVGKKDRVSQAIDRAHGVQ